LEWRLHLFSAGQVKAHEVLAMFYRVLRCVATILILSFVIGQHASAQWPQLAETTQNAPGTVTSPQQTPPPPARETQDDTLIVPVGTHLPLLLRNGVNTRTAKAGDVVYFETLYPISVNNRVVIPMGSFVKGTIVAAKRPGRIAGRGEFRIALEQMTFLNGYTIELRATPSSVDRDGREGVDAEGKIKGPGSVGRDVGLVAIATGGGAYLGTLTGAAINGSAGRGALIGGGAAGLGTLIAILATRGPEAELPRGTVMDVVFDRPLILSSSYLPANTAGNDPQRGLPPPDNERRHMQEALRQRMLQRSLRLPFPLVP
jgi:type IV secretion system protein VirB10